MSLGEGGYLRFGQLGNTCVQSEVWKENTLQRPMGKTMLQVSYK